VGNRIHIPAILILRDESTDTEQIYYSAEAKHLRISEELPAILFDVYIGNSVFQHVYRVNIINPASLYPSKIYFYHYKHHLPVPFNTYNICS
jgi:hypothetical protein